MRFLPFIIQFLVGIGLIIGGIFFTSPGDTTDDGLPLNWFLIGMGVFFIVLNLGILGGIIGFQFFRTAKRDFYVTRGRKKIGKLVALHPTGTTVNQQNLLRFEYTVNGKTHFTNKLLWPWEASKFNPGDELTVYQHPTKKEKYYLDL